MVHIFITLLSEEKFDTLRVRSVVNDERNLHIDTIANDLCVLDESLHVFDIHTLDLFDGLGSFGDGNLRCSLPAFGRFGQKFYDFYN